MSSGKSSEPPHVAVASLVCSGGAGSGGRVVVVTDVVGVVLVEVEVEIVAGAEVVVELETRTGGAEESGDATGRGWVAGEEPIFGSVVVGVTVTRTGRWSARADRLSPLWKAPAWSSAVPGAPRMRVRTTHVTATSSPIAR
jgi:hypothetical protein